ncbi:aspartate--tRNA(Asn) ligase [Spirochaeta lutea]|uniref:Aspartate--tRNA(Asp/Asn) ligase n=1 Tax=Spirochaeta lutea TaxID=1480694 RepID=A0A098QZK1_9SPIO|nr:aspartate--tRNA(Asn) ligase [Spirochaeta lutea]KGE71907.1 aspartyl-tRNA synthetase [Spirochaeta lutea]
MSRVLIKDIADHVEQEITLQGWVHRIRELGGINFVILRDRSGQAQLVYEGSVDVTLETVVSVSGRVQKNVKAPAGFELLVAETRVLATAAPDLPVPVNQDPKNFGIEAILDNRLISLRNPKIRSIFTLQSEICRYFAEYLHNQDFTEIKTSKLIGSGTEGGTGLFEVEYFDTKVYLAQSPQFYKQAMVSSGMERVFEVGAAYRAEKHETPRHLNEYISLDVEMGFIEDEHDLMDLESGILSYMFARIQEEHSDILELWDARVPSPEDVARAPRIAHEEAKKIVSQRLGRRVFEINPEAERVICEWAMEEYGVDLVYINEFPRKKRPFYTYPKGLKTMSFDLIFRGLEITTGGRRINEYPMLLETLPRFGLTEEGLGGYTDIFKYGCPPHGGFAIGLERITQKILGLSNVKEASLFPRDRKRIKP